MLRWTVQNCYCKFSSQGTVPSGSAADTSSSTNYQLGFGGSISAPSCDPDGTLTAGLVGYWKMDEASWNGTAGEVIDSSGTGNNGTAAGGVSTIFGKFGNAGNFNGSSGYVNTVNSVFFTTEFTVEAWFYKSIWKDTGVPDLNAGRMEVILSKWDRLPSADVGYRFERWYGGGYFGIIVSSGVDFGGVSANVPESSVPLNQWNHAVATFKGGQFLRLYLNGSLVAESTSGIYSQVTDAANFPHKIGVMSHGYGQFNGLIDDVRIYNRALSSQEISSLYNSGNGCI